MKEDRNEEHDREPPVEKSPGIDETAEFAIAHEPLPFPAHALDEEENELGLDVD